MTSIKNSNDKSIKNFKIKYLSQCSGSYVCSHTPSSFFWCNNEITLCFKHLGLLSIGINSFLQSTNLIKKDIHDITIKHADSGYCEYENCEKKNFVNIIGIHFDVWLCKKHLLEFHKFIEKNIDCIDKQYQLLYDDLLNEDQELERYLQEEPLQYKNLNIHHEIINHKLKPKEECTFWLGRSECNKYVEQGLKLMKPGDTKIIFLPLISNNLKNEKLLCVKLELIDEIT